MPRSNGTTGLPHRFDRGSRIVDVDREIERVVRATRAPRGRVVPGRAALNRPRRPAHRLLWARLREVEVHHVDLDAGYRFAAWPDDFVDRLLSEVTRTFARRSDAPALPLISSRTGDVWQTGPTPERSVTGDATELCAWLIGRSPGSGLRSQPAGPLPELPPWA